MAGSVLSGVAVALLLLQLTACVTARATYTIVAPRVLRPNLPFNVAITILDTTAPTRVTVQVGGRPDSGGNELKTKEVVVQPGVTTFTTFNIGDLGPGRYNLTAAGQGGLSFQNTTALEYVHKSYSVFIQTDKAIYKPGDLVRFRAVVLNPSLRPHTAGNLNAWVTDGKGNRIQQWDRQFTTNGVFTNSIQLSDQPVLGDWNLTIDVLGQRTSKVFEVAEYVLPRFEVTIDLPPYATFDDTSVTATVHAKYTYGKAVRGEVMVRAHPELKSTYLQPIFQDPVRKSAPIDGTADVTFNLKDELGLTNEDYERELVFDVIVTEELTGRAQNASAVTTIHRHKYTLQLVKTAENFKPGLKYTAFLKLATQDDMPVRGGRDKVTVKYGYTYNHENYTVTEYDVPSNGLLELTFFPPADNDTHALGIEAEYKGVNQWFSTVNKALSPSNSYIQATLETEEPRVGQPVTVRINSTRPVNQYVYEVLGLGQLQFAETMNAGGATTHQFRFTIRKDMVPRTRVVVYHILPDGEVVADALDFDVMGTFQNTVDIELGANKVEPGQEVDIKIKTRPDSYVCVLGIDQAVTVLKSGNDITQADVYEEMESYDSGRRPDGLPYLERQKRSLFFWPGTSTASQVFEDSGVVMLTNAYVHESFHLTYYRSAGAGAGPRPQQGPPQYLAAFGEAPSDSSASGGRLRTNFPETWLWTNTAAGTLGEVRLRETAPDTITSWMISAFSVDNLYGLGVSERPSKLQVFRPFFVSLNLPYAVKRGEVVGIQCVVFNYHQADLIAEVTLEHQGDLQFTSFSDEANNEVEGEEKIAPTLELFIKKQVLVPKNDGASVTFMVIPQTLGHVDIKVTARTSVAGDSVQRKLLVKPEGVPQVINSAMLVDLRNTDRFNSSVPIKLPRSFVNGSNSVEVSVIGDILGGSVGNLESLIQLPYGCGEQNMLRFVPNIVALDYLTGSGQITAGLQARAVGNMRTGYQRELSYRREDGSFSAFGDRDDAGSTWLTAFVIRSFAMAREYIEIDSSVMELGLKFLADNQASNGSFPEVGRVSHQPMQGGSARGVPLTAFTLLAFLDSEEGSQFSNAKNNAIDYLVRNIPTDPYELSVVAYALAKAGHPGAPGALVRLSRMATEEDDMRWWEKPLESLKNTSFWYGRPRPLDIEMTSYALLTYLERGEREEALPILRWLMRQRNDMGGFQSTQDTVVGMTALAEAADALQSADTDVSVRFIFGPRGKNMRVTRSNALTVQKYELPDPEVDTVEVSATGSGLAVVQVTHRYHVNVTGPDPSFFLSPRMDGLSNKRHIKVSACTGWEGEGDSSNMAVMEIELPSGFTVDEQSIPGLYKYRSVKRVETADGDTKVVIYFDEISQYETCPTVLGYYTAKVARQKRSAVTVYDYYDPTRMARQFYLPIQATLCDICEGDDCDPVQCAQESETSGQQTGDPDAAGTISLQWPSLLVAALVLAAGR
ncbi:CD109 antigen-like isoform X2 [Amphibalanus amphitrite]|uniref:CD109 antigen-like isoform X2 n=1 Tax=Amphibalanus amphitrite TaxID=1232801 RepID=UPI001C91A153|nr:CD109 antigen-like isoform X2 [Amphibalanus amphitrite]